MLVAIDCTDARRARLAEDSRFNPPTPTEWTANPPSLSYPHALARSKTTTVKLSDAAAAASHRACAGAARLYAASPPPRFISASPSSQRGIECTAWNRSIYCCSRVMGCDESKLVDESFAHFGDRRISSKANDKYAAKMKNAKAADEVIRVQIINGSLFTTCAGHGAEKAASIDCTLAGLRSRGAMMVHVLRTLDLLLSIGRVPDVDFFIDLSEHACYHHQTKNAKGADAWPVLTVETDDEKRCHNILGPPRAFISLPDAGRWLSRAASDAREWAWSERIPKAVWRGSATGGDPTDKNGKLQSARGKAVAASLERPDLLSAIFAGRGGTSPGLTHTHSCPPPTVLRALITQCHHTDSCCALCTMCMQARRCGQNRWWASLRPVRTRAST